MSVSVDVDVNLSFFSGFAERRGHFISYGHVTSNAEAKCADCKHGKSVEDERFYRLSEIQRVVFYLYLIGEISEDHCNGDNDSVEDAIFENAIVGHLGTLNTPENRMRINEDASSLIAANGSIDVSL